MLSFPPLPLVSNSVPHLYSTEQTGCKESWLKRNEDGDKVEGRMRACVKQMRVGQRGFISLNRSTSLWYCMCVFSLISSFSFNWPLFSSFLLLCSFSIRSNKSQAVNLLPQPKWLGFYYTYLELEHRLLFYVSFCTKIYSNMFHVRPAYLSDSCFANKKNLSFTFWCLWLFQQAMTLLNQKKKKGKSCKNSNVWSDYDASQMMMSI